MPKDTSRYFAQGLFEVALEHKTETQICIDLHTAAEAVGGNKQLSDFLLCPAVSIEEKTVLVAKSFHGSHLFKNFLDLLVRRRAFNQILKIAFEFKKLVDISKGYEAVNVVSPSALDTAKRKDLEDKLTRITGKKLEMYYTIDESLLAGIVVKFKDKIMDASLKNQFHILKTELTGDQK